MPLKSGKSRKIINSNTKELIDTYLRNGTIGTSHPQTRSEAVRQAYAIAMSTAKKK